MYACYDYVWMSRTEDLEADLVASLDVIGGCRAGLGSLVAAEVVAVHQLAREGGHVRVGVLSSVRILATHGGAVHDQAIEDVVRIDSEGREQGQESDGLHDGG